MDTSDNIYPMTKLEAGQKAMEITFDDYLVVNNATIALDGKADNLLCIDGEVRRIMRKAIPHKKRIYWCYD